VIEPNDNDVLYGRGGGTNHHPGNKRYRQMVNELKENYVNAKGMEKHRFPYEIVSKWRKQDPPGRFLKFNECTRVWYDVGDKKAREKTSQALREKAPLIRKKTKEFFEANNLHFYSYDEISCSCPQCPHPSTSFHHIDVDTSNNNGSTNSYQNHRILTRDHSLGTDSLNDVKSINNFTWYKEFSGLVNTITVSDMRHQQLEDIFTSSMVKRNLDYNLKSSPSGKSSSFPSCSHVNRNQCYESDFYEPLLLNLSTCYEQGDRHFYTDHKLHPSKKSFIKRELSQKTENSSTQNIVKRNSLNKNICYRDDRLELQPSLDQENIFQQEQNSEYMSLDYTHIDVYKDDKDKICPEIEERNNKSLQDSFSNDEVIFHGPKDNIYIPFENFVVE